MVPAIVGIFLFLLVCILFAGMYNRLVVLRNRFANAFAQIDVQLKRRYDLVPNLVEAVRGYMAHEKSTLDAVIAARNQAMVASREINPVHLEALAGAMNAESNFAGMLGRFRGLVEGYPNLKADQTVARLMEELTSAENRIAFARQAYNDAVMQYNARRQSVPTNIVAGIFGFGEAKLFEITMPAERETVTVKI